MIIENIDIFYFTIESLQNLSFYYIFINTASLMLLSCWPNRGKNDFTIKIKLKLYIL